MTPEQVREIVRRHRPRGWRVRESRHRYAVQSALAHWEKRTLYVPTLLDESALFLFLHECGHERQRHFHVDLPAHREEFEAEQYAIHVFRSEGIRLPKELLAAARARVREVIRKDEMRGVEIQLHVRKWAERCGR